jgi:hypothetical protein
MRRYRCRIILEPKRNIRFDVAYLFSRSCSPGPRSADKE